MYKIIEKYFWVFLVLGTSLGLIVRIDNDVFIKIIKPALMLMLFTVFLKSDIIEVLKRIKNIKQVLFLTLMYMIVIPLLVFVLFNLFGTQIAVGALLIAAMPAGAASPILVDILGGNKELSASITITTSIIAPFTVPALFMLLNIKILSINPFDMLIDIAELVFIPMILAGISKTFFPDKIEKSKHLYSAFNVFVLSVSIFLVMAAHHEIIFNESILTIFQLLGYAYLVFIVLHIGGYLIGFKEDRKGKISTTVGAAYINNGMAIVLAALYFSPYIVLLAVLAEIPWNTLSGPLKKVISMNSIRLIPVRVTVSGKGIRVKRKY